MMVEKLEIFRGMNGFVILTAQPSADMIIFSTWNDVIEYLSDQAGLWGSTSYPEISPDWKHAPEWATGWEVKGCWLGDEQSQNTHTYSEQRLEEDE